MSNSEFESYYSEGAATFGDRVAAAREALGMTQKDLSHRMGVKEKTIANWEKDMAEPRANKLQMLSGILNVSMRWLLTGVGPGLDEPTEEEDIPVEISQMLAEMRGLRSEAAALGERIGRLEKRMRAAIRLV